MKAYEIVSEVLKMMMRMAVPGARGIDIDEAAEAEVIRLGGKSYNKGYKPVWAKEPYPSVCCINVNSIIAHGIPTDYVFQEGDIVGFDLGVLDGEGNCGDAAVTVSIGQISNEKARLLRHARFACYEGIKQVRPGINTYEITKAIERYSLQRGFRVNRNFSGHGIGKEMHMRPHIYNTTEEKNEYAELSVGQILCIEPMLTTGKDAVGLMVKNGWSFVTSDGKPSAVFEHMVEVTQDGCKILTTHFDDSDDWENSIRREVIKMSDSTMANEPVGGAVAPVTPVEPTVPAEPVAPTQPVAPEASADAGEAAVANSDGEASA